MPLLLFISKRLHFVGTTNIWGGEGNENLIRPMKEKEKKKDKERDKNKDMDKDDKILCRCTNKYKYKCDKYNVNCRKLPEKP